MKFQENPFGQLPQFGPMAGPNGFTGQNPFLGMQMISGMFGDDDEKKRRRGISPLAMLSPMAGLMASYPKYAMFGISPALGAANLLGAFK